MCSIGKSWLFSILISHIKRNKFTNIAQDMHFFTQKEQPLRHMGGFYYFRLLEFQLHL